MSSPIDAETERAPQNCLAFKSVHLYLKLVLLSGKWFTFIICLIDTKKFTFYM